MGVEQEIKGHRSGEPWNEKCGWTKEGALLKGAFFTLSHEALVLPEEDESQSIVSGMNGCYGANISKEWLGRSTRIPLQALGAISLQPATNLADARTYDPFQTPRRVDHCAYSRLPQLEAGPAFSRRSSPLVEGE